MVARCVLAGGKVHVWVYDKMGVLYGMQLL